jgi:hypothetical protein
VVAEQIEAHLDAALQGVNVGKSEGVVVGSGSQFRRGGLIFRFGRIDIDFDRRSVLHYAVRRPIGSFCRALNVQLACLPQIGRMDMQQDLIRAVHADFLSRDVRTEEGIHQGGVGFVGDFAPQGAAVFVVPVGVGIISCFAQVRPIGLGVTHRVGAGRVPHEPLLYLGLQQRVGAVRPADDADGGVLLGQGVFSCLEIDLAGLVDRQAEPAVAVNGAFFLHGLAVGVFNNDGFPILPVVFDQAVPGQTDVEKSSRDCRRADSSLKLVAASLTICDGGRCCTAVLSGPSLSCFLYAIV